ncbi:hypothetical protein XM25_00825 [Devosia sp. H5989]|nr:hypothetical protein XM25_00825 [Devosia sp. H5989]
MRYWQVMQASASELPYAERKSELQMLSQHCQSDILRGICEKNLNMAGRRPVRQRITEQAVK